MARTATTILETTSEDPTQIPAEVAKYMLPKEKLVAMVRRHPAVLLIPAAQAVAGLLVAFILSATLLRTHTVLIWIVWGLWAVLMLRLIWVSVNWAVDYFVITSKRILLTSGVFTRNVAMMPLSKVTDMSFRRTFAGRMLGFGEFIVESAGQDQALRTIDHIPYPEDLYVRICGWIFEGEGGGGGGGGAPKGGGEQAESEELIKKYPPLVEGSPAEHFDEADLLDETDVYDESGYEPK
ncbi:MAG TPA: PH domain-containing protein [Streptosporangiaceae bacterium]